MRESIVLIGAGSAVFTRGLVADLIRVGEELDLRLVDVDPQALDVVERLVRKMVAARGAPIRVSASTERRTLLPGATAIICTVGVGGRRAWEQDVFIPRRYGINQPVGDTIMPGGTSRALRMIPAMVAIAEDVVEQAPQALFFNYGNPMAAVCRGVRKQVGAEMVGLCHGVNSVVAYLAQELGVPCQELVSTAVGMNHLTWFTEVRVRGVDQQPRLHEVARSKLEWLAQHPAADSAALATLSPFSWWLMLQFGAFPAVLDRHVTEFFPQFHPGGRYYGKTLGVDVYSFEGTIQHGDALFAAMCEQALSADPLPEGYFERIGGEHEQVVEIIDSMRRDTGRVFSVNLPNRGQVPNLPAEAVVECPALATASGLRPLAQPPLPAGLVGTLVPHLAWVETVAEAALEGNRTKVVQALVLDGAVSSPAMAEALAADLLAAQAQYLPQFE